MPVAQAAEAARSGAPAALLVIEVIFSYADLVGTGSQEARERAVRVVHSSFATEEGVYGVILVAGMVVVAGSGGDSSWGVFTTVVATVVVF